MGEVIVWDTKTYEKVFLNRDDVLDLNGVDFSPDSSCLVSASKNNIRKREYCLFILIILV